MPKTKVFLTWSGSRSQEVARALRKWLPSVIQNLDPWMSESDIDKGTLWGQEISGQLQQAKIGIICLTSENLQAPWINFEAGALSKLEGSYVCTYLLELATSDVLYPLAQFQATKAEKEDTRKLLHTLNKRLADGGLEVSQLDAAFDRWWPDLETSLSKIAKPSPAEKSVERTTEEMLEELINASRAHTESNLVVIKGLSKILDFVQAPKRTESIFDRSLADFVAQSPMRSGLTPSMLDFGFASDADKRIARPQETPAIECSPSDKTDKNN